MSIFTIPTTFLISSGVTFPGLNITGILSITFTTVDSNPISVSPPSIIAEALSSNSILTVLNVVPLGFPETFALGAAIGSPVFCIIFFAISFLLLQYQDLQLQCQELYLFFLI